MWSTWKAGRLPGRDGKTNTKSPQHSFKFGTTVSHYWIPFLYWDASTSCLHSESEESLFMTQYYYNLVLWPLSAQTSAQMIILIILCVIREAEKEKVMRTLSFKWMTLVCIANPGSCDSMVRNNKLVDQWNNMWNNSVAEDATTDICKRQGLLEEN